jgi:hypothetical protein
MIDYKAARSDDYAEMQRMMLFLVLIVWVFAPIAYFLNAVRMFMKDMRTLMELHLIWFKEEVPGNSPLAR